MKTVIYIAGLSHSGSTLLDFLLSHHKDILGLGEIYAVISGKKDNLEQTAARCSCGTLLTECSFWSSISPQKTSPREYAENYQQIIDQSDKFKKVAIIDSSKYIWPLEYLIKLQADQKINLKVVYLIRDVRGWAASFSQLGKKDHQWSKPPIYAFWLWYRRNQEIKRFFQEKKLNYLQISYEKLCDNPKKEIEKILKFTDLPTETFSFTNLPTSHIAFGNRTKLKIDSQHPIIYDNRWRNYFWIKIFYWLMPRLRLWNKQQVYG